VRSQRANPEEEATSFVREYIAKTGDQELTPPVPIEKLIEKLSDFDILYDSEELERNESGRIDFARKLITIRYDEAEVRQRFSLAHEAGHLRMHAHTIASGTSPIPGLFGDVSGPHLSRRGSKAWVEVEANRFAAAVLMPLRLLHPAIDHAKARVQHGHSEHKQILAEVEASLASKFMVSQIAMSLRLKNTGLAAHLFTNRLF